MLLNIRTALEARRPGVLVPQGARGVGERQLRSGRDVVGPRWSTCFSRRAAFTAIAADGSGRELQEGAHAGSEWTRSEPEGLGVSGPCADLCEMRRDQDAGGRDGVLLCGFLRGHNRRGRGRGRSRLDGCRKTRVGDGTNAGVYVQEPSRLPMAGLDCSCSGKV